MKFIKQTSGVYVAYFTNGMATLSPNKNNSTRYDILISEHEVVTYKHINAPSLKAAMNIAGASSYIALV